MRNLLISVALVLAAGLAASTIVYRRCCDPDLHQAARTGDAEHWLRREFHLSDAQMAAIENLQIDYDKECSMHCQSIIQANERLAAIRRAAKADPALLAGAQRVLDDREALCRDAIKAHLRRVAALMPPTEGKRYLAMLLPKVDTFRHEGAPNLRLDP